ncbi:TolC family protein [Polaribacter sp. M15]
MSIFKLIKERYKSKLVLVCLYVFTCYSVHGQIEFSSLQELFNYADDNSIILKTSDLNEQLYLSKNKESKTNLLPDINTSLGYNDNITLQPSLIPAQIFDPTAPEGEFSEIVFGTKYQYSRTMQAQWDVLNFQKIFAVEVSKLDISKAKASTELNRFNLYNQLASTYYSIILTQESIKVYEKNERTSKTILENASNQFDKGIISKSEYNQALINFKQIGSQLKSSKSSLKQYIIQLQTQLDTQDSIVVNDRFEVFDEFSLNSTQTHPEILLQEANLLGVEAQLKQTKALRYPTLSLVYQDTKTWATDEFFDFSDANDLPQQLFGVTLSLNPFDFSLKKKIQQSKINIELQKLELESSKLQFQKEDELLQLQFVQGMEQLENDKTILALQKENDQHTENLYQNGVISLDNRLEKFKELLNTQNNYLNSLASLMLSKYKKYIRQIDFESK